MKIIHVIVLERSGKDSLSYFGPDSVALGSVVSIPLRKKESHAVVVGLENVADAKALVKTANFSLRKIKGATVSHLYSESYIEAARQTAQYYVCSLGGVLSSTTPKAIFDFNLAPSGTQKTEDQISKLGSDKMIMQADDRERYEQYKSLIRESFSKKKSVLIVCPTIQESILLKTFVMKGIENYVFLLHSGLSKKKMVSVWENSRSLKHPIVLVSTPGYISAIRSDMTTIIVERESSPAYKLQNRPFFDYRYFIECLAERIRSRLILGDIMLRVETLYHYKEGKYAELVLPKWRSLSKSDQYLIDMKEYRPEVGGRFTIIGRELEALLEEVKSANDNLFLFVARKGLAPTTVCGDCGSILLCSKCGAPLVLHKDQKGERFYLCHRCGDRNDSRLRCRTCNSWKLVMLGVGVERVIEEIHAKFPGLKTFRLDRESARDRKAVERIIQFFFNSPGSVMVGTELAFPYLDRQVGYTAVVSMDSLFSIPDFKISERVMNILLKMRSIATKKFVVQTRQIELDLLRFATEGNLADFYQKEIKLRRDFKYPPFSVFVKISIIQGPKTAEQMAKLRDELASYPISIFPSFHSQKKNITVVHVLIKIPENYWPNRALSELLSRLPVSFKVEVDPDNLL